MRLFSNNAFDYLDQKTKKILMETRESFIPHTPYIYEKNMLAAVRQGDLELTLKCNRLMENAGKAGTLSKDPLQQSKILFISHITMLTRAAMDAGVAEDLAYAMSDSYIQTALDCTSPRQVQALTDRSLRDFVGAVRHQKNSPPYSRATRKAVNYIHSHLQEKITLKELADAAALSPGRFSHLFREETGLSPMAYIRKEKMETARTMLLYSEYKLSEISTILGFSSESHFIRTFKEYFGTTPGKLQS